MRVERQFARRARQHLGSAVDFCVYDRFRNCILIIEDPMAADLINGRVQIDFTPTPPSAAPTIRSCITELRRLVRRAARTNTTAYHAFQRLRGRRFTRDDIVRIQNEEFATNDAPKVPTNGPAKIADLPNRTARLDENTLFISGGLDWDFKDLGALATLKDHSKFRYCTIVHDIIPILFPHLVVPDLVPIFERYFSDLVTLADYAMCNSHATRRDWYHYCEQRGVEMPASVFPLGSDLSQAKAAGPAELPAVLEGKRFALFVSTIEPRKNHRTLYEAWDRCVRSKAVDATRDRLVFVGRQGWAINDLMRELSTNPATRDTLIVLNHVSDGLLRLLYQSCAFVAFPSLYEGYGLPVAEALAYGKPCISSNAGSLPEIGRDLVVRIDPRDTIRWADALAHFLRTPAELDRIAARIKGEYQPMTWDQASAEFFSTIKTIADRPKADHF